MTALLLQLITNTAIISLLIGLVLGLFNLISIPALLSNAISLYLIFTIGLKGGMCLGVTHACTPPLIELALVGILLGFLTPFVYHRLLKYIKKLDSETAIVIASQYGSISIVTFVTAITFLHQHQVMYDTFMSAIAGIMEIPAIFSGMLLYAFANSNNNERRAGLLRSCASIAYEIITSKKINSIFIGFFVGFLLRNNPQHIIPSTILAPFTVILTFFMIDIGIKIAHQRAYIAQFTWSLIAFGIVIPIISGILGIMVCYVLNISLGSTLLFAVLTGSASYIAVPAIMGTQIENAKEVIYLPLALGITLAFNLIIGIPLFFRLAQLLNMH